MKRKKYTEEDLIKGIKLKDDKVVEYFYNKYEGQFIHYLKKHYPKFDKNTYSDIYHRSIIRYIKKIQAGKKLEVKDIKTYLLRIGRFFALKHIRSVNQTSSLYLADEFETYLNIPETIRNEDIEVLYEILDKALLEMKPFEADVMRDCLQHNLKTDEMIEKYDFNNSRQYITQKYKYKIKLENIILKIYDEEYKQTR